MNKYKLERINFSQGQDDWKKFKKNNVTIALNVLYAKKEKIYPAYVSKHNSNREKQVILLMTQIGEERKGRRQHYLAVIKLSALLRQIASKNNSEFYCLNCLHSFRTENKLELYKTVCENKDFCNAYMPSEDIQILKYRI